MLQMLQLCRGKCDKCDKCDKCNKCFKHGYGFVRVNRKKEFVYLK